MSLDVTVMVATYAVSIHVGYSGVNTNFGINKGEGVQYG